MRTAKPTAYASTEMHLHPCRIQNQWHLVYHPALAQKHPHILRLINRRARRQGWLLLADRRAARHSVSRCRRQWLSRLMISLACLAEPALGREEPLQSRSLSAMPETLRPKRTLATTAVESSAFSHQKGALYADEWPDKIRQILQDHWQPTPTDPPTLAQDLSEISTYFSAFPEVRDLLTSLHGKKWRLKFAANTFATRVTGSRLSVSHATVSFDPHAAAQYKFHNACAAKRAFCVAAPADVLLHELLHTRQALLNTNQFIGDGGLNQNLYPHRHEQKVIFEEQKLYYRMSHQDQNPRPQRQEHHGKSVRVACATCLN